MQGRGRCPYVVAVRFRRGFSGLHIHDEVALAHDETMGERVRREGYHMRAPDPRGRTQEDRIIR
jgi:hypothetical protein